MSSPPATATAPSCKACPEPRGTQVSLRARGVDGVRPPAVAQPFLVRPGSSAALRGPACLIEAPDAGQAIWFLELSWAHGEEEVLT